MNPSMKQNETHRHREQVWLSRVSVLGEAWSGLLRLADVSY